MDTSADASFGHRHLTVALAFAVACGLAVTLAGFLGRFAWWLDVFANFRPHLAVLGGVAMLVCLAARRRRLAAVAAVALCLNAAPIVPLYVPRHVEPPPDGATLRLMHFNVHGGSRAYAAVAAAVRGTDADLVFLQEGMDDAWLAGLAAAGLGEFEHVYRSEHSAWRGLAVFARRDAVAGVEILSYRTIHPRDDTPRTMLEVVVRVDGVEAAILSIHPPPPLRRASFRVRNAMLAAAGEWAAAQTRPCVVIGDFNATPWSSGFRHLMASGGLVDSQRGHGIDGTWAPWDLGLGHIPIDHCVHSESIVTTARRVGLSAGSDHLPLHVMLALPRPVQGK